MSVPANIVLVDDEVCSRQRMVGIISATPDLINYSIVVRRVNDDALSGVSATNTAMVVISAEGEVPKPVFRALADFRRGLRPGRPKVVFKNGAPDALARAEKYARSNEGTVLDTRGSDQEVGQALAKILAE